MGIESIFDDYGEMQQQQGALKFYRFQRFAVRVNTEE